MNPARFSVFYHLAGDEASCLDRARGIRLEQTVEVGDHLVPPGFVRDHVVGRLEDFGPVEGGLFTARISYLVESTGGELPQLLNIVFGNVSLIEGVRVHDLDLGPDLESAFKGPRFGIAGLRNILRVPHRPLLCSALKPVGLPNDRLADLAYRFALGGVDLIKDDHGLADQPFSPFEERVSLCVEAVNQANRETGLASVYVPCLNAPADRLLDRARLARREGAGGLMMTPGLAGFDSMRLIAEDDEVGLPILSHPALLGPFVTDRTGGFSHQMIFGKLQRIAGADASIFPNYGGRFGFSEEDCRRIGRGCREPMGPFRPIFPVPAGGMSLARVPEMVSFYGSDFMMLLGGSLLEKGPGLTTAVRELVELLEGLSRDGTA